MLLGKEARIEARSSRLAARPLKTKAEKETVGVRISNIELLGRITDTGLDDDGSKKKE